MQKKNMNVDSIRQDLCSKITKYAIYSRLMVIVLQYVANVLIPDHNAKVFVTPINENFNFLDELIHHFLGGFARWDAQYFLHVAKYGYTYENTVVFFPLFPLIIRYVCLALSYFYAFISFSSMFLLVSVCFNIYIFVKTAWVLFEISSFVESPSPVYRAMMIFFFNPASVFFSAPYSECLFCYLTLKSILCCIQYVRKYTKTPFTYVNFSCLKCIFYISLSTCTRSNGVLNLGFFIYFYVLLIMEYYNNTKRSYLIKYTFLVVSAVVLLFYISVMLLPFAFIQVYDYINYCRNFESNVPDFLKKFANDNNFVLPGTFSKHNQTWCYDKIPLAYSYVQKHYWNVGFLQYFKIRQIPNFFLAAPVILLVTICSITFFLRNKQYFLHLGIFERQYFGLLRKPTKGNSKKSDFDLKLNVQFVCILHAFVLTLFCTFCIHVQVTTRMVFSATPCIYWFCAKCYSNRFATHFMRLYCLLYYTIGTVIFCNFLPWT